MNILSLIPDRFLEDVLTEDKINQVGDELLEINDSNLSRGFRVALIKKEKDGNYYIHKCNMEYNGGHWVIQKIITSSKISELLKQILKWKNKQKKS